MHVFRRLFLFNDIKGEYLIQYDLLYFLLLDCVLHLPTVGCNNSPLSFFSYRNANVLSKAGGEASTKSCNVPLLGKNN